MAGTPRAINEHVVQRDIQRQGTQTEDHCRAGATHAVAEAAQHVIERDRWQTGGNAVQVLHARRDQFRVDLHDVQDRLGSDQHAGGHQADHQRQPQRLTHNRSDFAVSAGAEALGHFWRGRQQGAGHQQKHRHPDRIAQRHGGEVSRPDAAGHHGIDEAHGGGRQLRDHDRQRQGKQVFQLQANPGRAVERACGGGVSYGIHKRSVQRCLLRKATHSTR